MIKFSSNPLLFKIQYINRDTFETAGGISGIIGKAFHHALEVYCGGSDTVVPANESEAIKLGLEAGVAFLTDYNDGFINFSKTIPNKQKAIELLTFGFTEYVKYKPYDKDNIIAIEDEIKETIDVEWRGAQLKLPVPLKGFIDKIVREDGKLKIKDYKTTRKFSDPEKIDGAKIIQAVEYYLLAYAKYKEEPYSVTFEEIKLTKNDDKSPQLREYEIVFADNDLYFDFYFRFYEDMVRALNGEMVFVPNVNTLFDNEISIIAYIHRLDVTEETAKLMKKLKVKTLTELLKKEIQGAGNMRKLMKGIEDQFVSAKNIDYSKMKTEEKIQTKMLEHAMVLTFDSVIEGATVDLYQYNPTIGLKMSRIRNYVDDIEQILGVSGVRVLAPIPDTSLVGFEVPRANRTFPALPAPKKGYEIAIGQNVMGKDRRIDIREAPHILVAGASGSGKSVFLNSIITQLKGKGQLYLFDPKIVELAQFKENAKVYKTDPDEINDELFNLVKIMEERYKELAGLGLRNIEGTKIPYIFAVIDEFGDISAQNPEGYTKWELCKTHQRIDQESRGELSAILRSKRKLRVREQDIFDSVSNCENCKKHVIPSFEANILRLASKGRAAGIHLIIATQSPRVDVIKGSIKANFPVKIVFKTAKAVDSLVVIDDKGAEKLLGKGDMLFTAERGVERLQGYLI